MPGTRPEYFERLEWGRTETVDHQAARSQTWSVEPATKIGRQQTPERANRDLAPDLHRPLVRLGFARVARVVG